MLAAWDPGNPRACAFRHVFYDDASREAPDGKYVAPSHAELQELRAAYRAAGDDLLWDRADMSNPDPTRLVPKQVTGFHGLQQRCDQQREEVAVQRAKLRDLEAAVRDLADRREVDMRLKLDAYRSRHAALSHRLLVLMGKIEHLRARRAAQHHHATVALGAGFGRTPGLGGAVELTSGELHLQQQYAGLLDEIQSSLALRTRLQSLRDRLAQLTALEVEAPADGGIAPAASEKLAQVLAQQQESLSQLLTVLNKDLKDLELIRQQTPELSGPMGTPARPSGAEQASMAL